MPCRRNMESPLQTAEYDGVREEEKKEIQSRHINTTHQVSTRERPPPQITTPPQTIHRRVRKEIFK